MFGGWMLLVWFTLQIQTFNSLTITGLEFPNDITLGQSVTMICRFTVRPNQKLDSVKWYKDAQEFYRLHPSGPALERKKYFNLPGVKIDNSSTEFILNPGSGEHRMALHHTGIASTGTYRCQITEAQAPFHTEQIDKDLNVIIRPEEGSPIMIAKPTVGTIGQEINLRCSSDRSKPAAQLSFFINGERVPEDRMSREEIITEDDGKLESSFRSMSFIIQDSHYVRNGIIEVKCNAKIGEAYWKSATASIQLQGRPSYMLESRSSANSGISLLSKAVLFLYLSPHKTGLLCF
ncbi:uncharacterized protein LOC111702032 isoform X2 [Eurytemora carolleeae]|uniref:uncharacterized protein LOC111702032 isoform X1 n=1 Tax=Eurytemora carolleeae TaxID=1294199 RepID=UPI000C7800CC|nr:uncharacterized protein LOC111702032 isoform X1 [Eurytemora carolleeae]XP_023329322.1 uncharacterized protein LOC111702032 isoform X2 [Eurytemora carolleeae]|eukprot:XP_023329321.1 uncharacterized protein LOC111702032 isoform X1 [Eurytemora affinis]